MCKIKFRYCECCRKYANVNDDFLESKCLCFNKTYRKTLHENLKKDLLIHSNFLSMTSMHLFCWKFTETSIPEKEDFYSHLNMEYVTDAHCTHIKRICKDFEMKKIDKYHCLYVQDNTLLLAGVLKE